MPTPRALVRPAASLVAALLVTGVALTAPAAPAAADETTGPALSVAVDVDGTGAGSSADRPAALGSSPASAALVVVVTNTGTEPVTGLDVVTTVVDNGTVGAPSCDQAPSVVLEPGATVRCGTTVSGVAAGRLHEDLTTATARTVADDVEVSAATRFFATAVDDSVTVGDRVWLDVDGDGRQDADEPGLAGVRLTVTGPDGLAVPDLDAPGRVLGPQLTDADGAYAFTRLAPLPDGGRYTVAVDPTSSPLADLVPTVPGVGDAEQDSSTSPATSSALAPSARDLSLDLGFTTAPVTPPVPTKAAVALTVDASPEPALTGSTITVRGTLRRAGQGFAATTVLEHADDGTGTWSRVATVRSSSRGALSTTTKAVRSGSFRFRYAGDVTTEAGVSAEDRVEVRKAAVRLTVGAPSSVTKGSSIKVGGSIRREGKGYRAETALEFRASGDDGWSRVKKVRSSSKGALSATVKPTTTGDYRYRYAGSSTTEAGASGADRVVVKPKPPAKPKPKRYDLCEDLNEIYPHGVGRSGAKDRTKSGKGPVTNFVRDTKTYNLNTARDADDDGVACERH